MALKADLLSGIKGPLVEHLLGLLMCAVNVLENKAKLCDSCLSLGAPEANDVLMRLNLDIKPIQGVVSIVKVLIVTEEDTNTGDLVDLFISILHNDGQVGGSLVLDLVSFTCSCLA